MAAFLNVCRFNPTAGSTTDWTYSSAVTGYNSPALAGVVNSRVYKYRAESTDLSQWEIGEGAYNTGTGVLARTTVLYNSSGTGTATGQSGAGSKISFSAAPTVAIVAVKEDLLSIEEANSFTGAQQAQARINISSAQIAAMAAHNVVVNPAIDVSQELGTTGATLTNNTAKYTADQWEAMYNHGAATAVVTSGQIASGSFGSALAGFQFGHQIKATTAISSPASGDFGKHRQKIEGYRIAHWGWGATGASSIVIAFQYYSTASGTAFVKLSNSDQSRCYYHEITVAAGWNFYAFSVAGDTTGTWQATTSAGLVFEVFSSGKETTPASSLDAWGSTNKVQTTNSTNLLVTANNLTVLTGIYIDVGTQLPVAANLPLLMRPLTDELLVCKRYWEKSYEYGTAIATVTNTGAELIMGTGDAAGNLSGATRAFGISKRTTPTMTAYSPTTGTSGKARDNVGGADITVNVASSSENSFWWYCVISDANIRIHWTATARL